ncbi:MAG: hypothetical protein KY468_02505 [Armatimonadetes bacterium]|nr:hypothetical protein [Armatimonadota bacterium]
MIHRFVEWRCARCRKTLSEILMAPVGFLCPRCKRMLCRKCAGNPSGHGDLCRDCKAAESQEV